MTAIEILDLKQVVDRFNYSVMNGESARINDYLKHTCDDTERHEKMKLYLLLQKIMVTDVAHFSFIKKDGTIREAFGTRSYNLIQAMSKAVSPVGNGPERIVRGDAISYYDIEKKDWRSLKISNLISVNTEYII